MRATPRRDAIDDPMCHDCLIAVSYRATITNLRTERDNLLAEIAILKGTRRMGSVERVAHTAPHDHDT